MAKTGTVQIEQVLGPRLERGGVVIETRTRSGQVALRLSAGAAINLHQALTTLLAAAQGPELSEFLLSEIPLPAASHPS